MPPFRQQAWSPPDYAEPADESNDWSPPSYAVPDSTPVAAPAAPPVVEKPSKWGEFLSGAESFAKSMYHQVDETGKTAAKQLGSGDISGAFGTIVSPFTGGADLARRALTSKITPEAAKQEGSEQALGFAGLPGKEAIEAYRDKNWPKLAGMGLSAAAMAAFAHYTGGKAEAMDSETPIRHIGETDVLGPEGSESPSTKYATHEDWKAPPYATPLRIESLEESFVRSGNTSGLKAPTTDIMDESGRSIAPRDVNIMPERPPGPWDSNVPSLTVKKEEDQPTAKFAYDGPEGRMYDIQGGSSDKSSVSEAKLKELGIEIPQVKDEDVESQKNARDAAIAKQEKWNAPDYATPIEEESMTEPQFARSEQGGIKIGVNIKRAADEVTTGYSGPLAGIMMREGMQNAIDAVRHLNTEGKIEVAHDDEGITINDNGKGMNRQELETVYSNLNESGKGAEIGATGGKGIGKASYILGGKHFQITTVKQGPSGNKIELTSEGTPDQFMEHVPISEKVVPPDTPTGTKIQVKFKEGQARTHASLMLGRIQNYSRGTNTNVVDKSYGAGLSKQLNEGKNDRIIGKDTFTEGGKNDVVLRVPKDSKLDDRSMLETQVLNNGMYQYTDYHFLGKETPNMPREIIVDIHPHAEEGTSEYPFPASRESIKEALKKNIKDMIDLRLVRPEQQGRQNVLAEQYDGMTLPNQESTQRTGSLLDQGSKLTPKELVSFQKSRIIRDLTRSLDNTVGDILHAVGDPVTKERLEGIGTVLDPKLLGIHIPNPSNGGKTSTILVNFMEHFLKPGSPADSAFNAVVTTLHEVAHIGLEAPSETALNVTGLDDPRVGKFLQAYFNEIGVHGGINQGHAVSFIKRIGEVFAKYGATRTFDAADEITRVVTDEHGGYNPETKRLLQIYQESRGRAETKKDFLSATGDAAKRRGGGETNAGDNQPNGEGTPIDRLRSAIKAGLTARTYQDQLASKEVGRRAAAIGGVKTGGLEGYYQKLGMLKGELPKIPVESQLSQEDVDSLVRSHIDTSDLKPFEKVNAVSGLLKLLGGHAPQPYESKLLGRAFGPDIEQLINLHGGMGGMGSGRSMVNELVNLPKSMMTMIHFSAPFKQGLPLIHTRAYWNAFKDMFKFYGDQKAFDAAQIAIHDRPYYVLGHEAGLFIAEDHTDLTEREEEFVGTYGEKLPILGMGIRAAKRAYVGFLNTLRSQTFDDLVDDAKNVGHDPFEIAHDVARFVNVSTGRGNLGPLEKIAVELNGAFWSPRLISSRLTMLNPTYYTKASPFVRKESLKALLSVAGFGISVATLAKLAGAKVSPDPTSTDFGKAVIGQTRLDPDAGFQQYIVAATRLITGKDTSASGRVSDLNNPKFGTPTRFDVMSNLVRSKESPIASFIDSMLQGSRAFPATGLGREVSSRIPSGPMNLPPRVDAEIINRYTPMLVNSLIDIYRTDPKLLPLGIPAALGMGIQTYENPVASGSKLRLSR